MPGGRKEQQQRKAVLDCDMGDEDGREGEAGTGSDRMSFRLDVPSS